jgi:hypothetical protein
VVQCYNSELLLYASQAVKYTLYWHYWSSRLVLLLVKRTASQHNMLDNPCTSYSIISKQHEYVWVLDRPQSRPVHRWSSNQAAVIARHYERLFVLWYFVSISRQLWMPIMHVLLRCKFWPKPVLTMQSWHLGMRSILIITWRLIVIPIVTHGRRHTIRTKNTFEVLG